MGKGLNRHLREVKEEQLRLNVRGIDNIFDQKKGGGRMKMYKKSGSEIVFQENVRQLLNLTQKLASNSPDGSERKEYAQKGKLETAKLLKELFPKQEDQRKVLGIARRKVLETRNDEFPYPNGAYYFACPEDARRSGSDLALLREAEAMGIEITLKYKKIREIREALQNQIVEKLFEKTNELIAFVQRQNVFLSTEKVVELVEKLTTEGKYEEIRGLLRTTGRGDEVKKTIAEKKATKKTVAIEIAKPKLDSEAKTETPTPETSTSTPEI